MQCMARTAGSPVKYTRRQTRQAPWYKFMLDLMMKYASGEHYAYWKREPGLAASYAGGRPASGVFQVTLT